jgi:hypothetical protein
MFEPFIQKNEQVVYALDPTTKRADPGRWLNRHIHNMMEESEAAKIKKCCS